VSNIKKGKEKRRISQCTKIMWPSKIIAQTVLPGLETEWVKSRRLRDQNFNPDDARAM
jgi:hypothetical protein